MISKEIKATADHLIELIRQAAETQIIPDTFHSEVRSICRELLDTADIDDNGGCPLCGG